MKAICPNCNFEFEARRNPMGAGTKIDPLTPLSFTETQVFLHVPSHQALEVRGIQNILVDHGIKKNYHQVQAALSTLVGRGIVKMDVQVFPPRYYR